MAPTKLVDGAWLYGLLAHARNPRFTDLVATYVEELGEGHADKNHVLLYRQLLERHGLHPLHGLPDVCCTQGALQLALGCNAGEFLPEIIGFNLGYEQLPLHLLITAYELNELGIDPYYFTLHITVDNADSGHAQRAVQAVQDMLPRFGDSAAFWQRVHNGSRLGQAGLGTTEVIAGFDSEREVEAIFSRKRMIGQGAHSDYCRVAWRGAASTTGFRSPTASRPFWRRWRRPAGLNAINPFRKAASGNYCKATRPKCLACSAPMNCRSSMTGFAAMPAPTARRTTNPRCSPAGAARVFARIPGWRSIRRNVQPRRIPAT